MTITELAALANVSQSTVSKAFLNAKDISEETRQFIFKFAREHHCYEKFYKGNYFKKIVAVICPEIKSERYHRIATYLETLLVDAGATMVLSLSHFDAKTEEALYHYHAYFQKVDGIIIIETLATLKDNSDVPTVRIGETPQKKHTNFNSLSQAATNDAVKHLIDMGHHKIAFIGEKLASAKLERFRTAMKKWFLPIRNEYVVISEERFETGGYKCMEKLLALEKPPTAVIAAYDYMALGALRCIKEHGLSVPEDISLIGQDNILMSEFVEPPLTSISSSYQEQCKLAVRQLQKKMQNKYYVESQEIIISNTLITRDSVKNIK